ncbi:uncharacterized protein LOC110178314 [Drosophila serrata]|uniref:uncharacterized protein LOC110178314 n=1 Tax=Drosophila serrata TaxID=7274 RepID=UPI000A1D14F3|nr:uncharacterized protein LOC110178314 [Drosophila serrata]KAH8375234.1 hypothetical protein KR200_001205 [Drosophila serrata]
MSVFKAIFLLSLLAIILAPQKAQSQSLVKPEWSKFAKCSHVLIEAATQLARNIVPTVYEINKCTGYVVESPGNGGKKTLFWYAKITFEFLKKLVLDQPKCLLNLLDKVIVTLKPYVEQIGSIGCLDENDYFY